MYVSQLPSPLTQHHSLSGLVIHLPIPRKSQDVAFYEQETSQSYAQLLS
jgi:hypothetical protein